MSKKGFKKIPAGQITIEDLQSPDTLYITDTDEFFEDSSIKKGLTGPYDAGRNLRKSAVNAVLEMLAEESKPEDAFEALKGREVNDLFEELLKLPGVGVQSAMMLCIAMQKKVPKTEHILAAQIHKELFIEYSSKNNPTYLGRNDDISTLIDKKVAMQCARKMAVALLQGVKLKEKPTVERLVELAFANTTEWKGCVGDTRIMQAECKLYHYLVDDKVGHIDHQCDEYTSNMLSSEQLEVVDDFFQSSSKAQILKGGPGTGKSTIITAIDREYRINGMTRPLITSYTNKACLNLKQRILDYGVPQLRIRTVPTINSLWYRLQLCKKHDEGSPLRNVTLIIVDESSMMSSITLAMVVDILEQCHEDCRLLLVGDVNQLPPVCQYGTPFFNANRLLKKRCEQPLRLSEFRRSNGVEIFEAFRRFRSAGDHTITASDEVSLMTVGTIDVAKTLVANMYKNPDFPELCCIAETRAMVDAINIETVQTLFGLDRDEFVVQKSTYEIINIPLLEDVRIVANDNIQESKHCSDKIGRSEFGTIVKVGPRKSEIRMDIGNRVVTVSTDLINSSFSLGYASTVHKYQGSESDEVVYVLENSANQVGNSFYEQKELKYVGLSRAKKKLDIIAIERGTSGMLKDKPITLHVSKSAPAKMCF